MTIEGPSEGRLTVTGTDETPPLQFKLRGSAIGPAQVRVLAFQQGQPLGMMTLSALVKESAAAATAAGPPSEQPLAPVSVRLPDLSLVIFESREGDETILTMRLTAADSAENLNFKSFGPVRLKTDPARYFGAPTAALRDRCRRRFCPGRSVSGCHQYHQGWGGATA